MTAHFIPFKGAQGLADGYASAEHSGGAVQPPPLPGANALPLRKHLHAGVWRPQDRGAGGLPDFIMCLNKLEMQTYQIIALK